MEPLWGEIQHRLVPLFSVIFLYFRSPKYLHWHRYTC